MALGTSIAWADATINTGYGCGRISSGCDNCYMFRMLEGKHGRHLNPNPEKPVAIPLWQFEKRITSLGRRPRRVFLNSMTDTFHSAYTNQTLDDWFKLIATRGINHTWLVLTKRAVRLQHYFAYHDIPPNVWLGVSVESRAMYKRIRTLCEISASAGRRFLSVEPLLEPVDDLPLDGIDWVLVGGESDYSAPRPFDEEWARSIRDRCVARSIPFFYKQSGGTVNNGGHWGSNLLDGRTWEEVPPLYSAQKTLTGEDAQ